jgi:hypothetical protein
MTKSRAGIRMRHGTQAAIGPSECHSAIEPRNRICFESDLAIGAAILHDMGPSDLEARPGQRRSISMEWMLSKLSNAWMVVWCLDIVLPTSYFARQNPPSQGREVTKLYAEKCASCHRADMSELLQFRLRSSKPGVYTTSGGSGGRVQYWAPRGGRASSRECWGEFLRGYARLRTPLC